VTPTRAAPARPAPAPAGGQVTRPARGIVAVASAKGGVGKSMLALKIIEQALAGGELFGAKFRSVPVISLDGENAPGLIHNRIQLTTIRAGDPLHVYAVPIAILGLEDLTTSLIDYLSAEHGDGLFVIDSQRALWSGDEKEQDQAGIMLRGLARHLEGKKSAVLIIHHDTKAGAYSGTSDINAALSGCRLHLERSKNPTEQSTRHLTQPKNRIAQEAPRRVFELAIECQPSSHRASLSGITLVDKEDSKEAKYQMIFNQAKTLACNAGGVLYRDLWTAIEWKWGKDGPSRTHADDWTRLKKDMHENGFKSERDDTLYKFVSILTREGI
jgi:RecA-family ATPase